MDLEDDMHDANDPDDSLDSADLDYSDSDDSDDIISNRYQQSYTILSEDDIRQRQEDDIMQISTVLSISKVAARILLCHFKWSVSKVPDEWFADEEKVWKAVGLLVDPVVKFPNDSELTCGICFGTSPCNRIHAAACGHPFCDVCWRGYVSTSINYGPGCLMLCCPDPSCSSAVGHDMISLLASEEDKEKYSRYFLRSYVEGSKKIKWCPAPGCDYALEFIVGRGSYDVTCRCSYSFCWNCMEEAHRPVDCRTVAKWKNSAKSENMNWFCLGAWPDHDVRTGGFMHAIVMGQQRRLRNRERWPRTRWRDILITMNAGQPVNRLVKKHLQTSTE